MLLTPAVLQAATTIVEQWETVRASGARDETPRFIGSDVDKFHRDARALYDLIKPNRGQLDWHPDTSSMLRIKVAAESILIAHARQTAGNSGSH